MNVSTALANSLFPVDTILYVKRLIKINFGTDYVTTPLSHEYYDIEHKILKFNWNVWNFMCFLSIDICWHFIVPIRSFCHVSIASLLHLKKLLLFNYVAFEKFNRHFKT